MKPSNNQINCKMEKESPIAKKVREEIEKVKGIKAEMPLVVKLGIAGATILGLMYLSKYFMNAYAGILRAYKNIKDARLKG